MSSCRFASNGIRSAVLAILLLARVADAGEPYLFRGVIFGPYGRPWSHADRLDLLGWMGGQGLNHYVHAAKDDVYQRAQWRDPYPPEVLAQYAAEVAVAHAAGVEWVPNVSPGFPLIPSPALPNGPPSIDICFQCDGEVDVLVGNKLEPFYFLQPSGVRTFMVSFDDVQKFSSHPEDRVVINDAGEPVVGDEAYGVLTARLLNAVLAALQSLEPDEQPITLLTVPADYSGTSRTAYLKGFGEHLNPAVRVMWTGTAVVSHVIEAADAEAYRRAIWPDLANPPKLLVWDNYPVNDYNGNFFSGTGLPTGFKLNVGPYKGRHADLVAQIDGIFSNPMNEAQASKIPLFTIARYLNDPSAYTGERPPTEHPLGCPYDSPHEEVMNDAAGCRAEKDWQDGIDVIGGAAADSLRGFLSQMRSTPLDRTEATGFQTRWKAFRAAFDDPFWSESWADLFEELTREGNAAWALVSGQVPNPQFVYEARNHLAQLEQNVEVGRLTAEMLAAERPRLTNLAVTASVTGVVVSGSAFPADPALVARRAAELVPLEVEMRLSPYSVHGDRFQQDLGNVYYRENTMDEFTAFAHEVTAAWLPTAALAAVGPLTVTVNGGAPVTVSPGGSFLAAGPAATGDVEVVVEDAAGHRTGERLPAP